MNTLKSHDGVAEFIHPLSPPISLSISGGFSHVHAVLGELPVSRDFHPGSTPQRAQRTKEAERQKQEHKVTLYTWDACQVLQTQVALIASVSTLFILLLKELKIALAK